MKSPKKYIHVSDAFNLLREQDRFITSENDIFELIFTGKLEAGLMVNETILLPEYPSIETRYLKQSVLREVYKSALANTEHDWRKKEYLQEYRRELKKSKSELQEAFFFYGDDGELNPLQRLHLQVVDITELIFSEELEEPDRLMVLSLNHPMFVRPDCYGYGFKMKDPYFYLRQWREYQNGGLKESELKEFIWLYDAGYVETGSLMRFVGLEHNNHNIELKVDKNPILNALYSNQIYITSKSLSELEQTCYRHDEKTEFTLIESAKKPKKLDRQVAAFSKWVEQQGGKDAVNDKYDTKAQIYSELRKVSNDFSAKNDSLNQTFWKKIEFSFHGKGRPTK